MIQVATSLLVRYQKEPMSTHRTGSVDLGIDDMISMLPICHMSYSDTKSMKQDLYRMVDEMVAAAAASDERDRNANLPVSQ